MELTLKDRKALINTGELSPQKQSLLEKMNPVGALLGSTTGLSTLADRKAIRNLPKFELGKADTSNLGGSLNSGGLVSNSAGQLLSTGLTLEASEAIKNLPTGPSKAGGINLKGIGSTLGTVGGAVASNLGLTIDFTSSVIDAHKFTQTADDLLQDAGESQGNIGGISYNRQNDVNSAQISALTSAENKANTVGLMGKGAALGASVGSVIPGVGTVIGGAVGAIGGLVGGLFGSSKRKAMMRRRIAEAKDRAFRQNDFSRSGALTSAMQQQYAQEFGDTESQSLYGFAEGLAQTPFGFASGKLTNAYGSNGEFAVQRDPLGNVIAATKLGHGRDNKDTVPIVVDDKTEIYTNKKVEIAPGVKVRPSEYFENTGDANGANYMTAMNIQKKKGYKCGKLPKFNEGLWSNIIGHGFPLISEIVQGNKISKQEVKSPDTYSGNEFLNTALYTLGQQLENPYAIMPELYNEYAKGMYALSNNGGLSGGLRALARLTAMNNFMNLTAKLQQAAQSANIAHKQTFANAMLNTGAQNATNRSAAKRYDLDYYSKAHAAKLAGEQEARKGAYAQLMAGIKGIVDNRRYDEAMGLYREKSKSEKDYYDALTRNLFGNKVTAKNSKDWSWLPEVYGPLNKGASIQANPVNSGIYYNPMSFYGTGALSPMMYKYNGPKLTKPTVKLY